MMTITSTEQITPLLTTQANRLMGQVVWMQRGLQGLTLKLRVGNTLTLKVRSDTRSMETTVFTLGQWVVVNLPLESMYLVSPEVPVIKKRWTRWEGRIVLSARPENDLCLSGPTTIKVLGEQVTLRTNRILGGKSAPTQVGDRAIVMIDPRALHIVSTGALARPSPPVFSQPPVPSGKVRLYGVIKTTRPSNAGLFVTVQIGHAVVSAHVTGDKATADCWPVGGRMALTVGEHDASVQALAMPMPPQPCLLSYLAGEEERPRMPMGVPPLSTTSFVNLSKPG